MMENKYDIMDRFQYHEKQFVKQIKYVIGDDDPMHLPNSPHLIQKQSVQTIQTPALHKNLDQINMSESIQSNSNTIARIANNTVNTNTQNLINTKQQLNETLEAFIFNDKKRNTTQSPVNSQNSNEQKIEEIQLDLNHRPNSKKQNSKENKGEHFVNGYYQNDDNDDDEVIENQANRVNKPKSLEEIELEGMQQNDTDNKVNKMEGLSTRRSLHNSSSLQLEDYFNQDVDRKKKEQMDRIINDITKFKSYFVKFRINLFIEFYFYHALFVIFLGPLANPIISRFGKGLPRNLMFWGANQVFFYQLLFYVLSCSAIVLYAIYPSTEYVFFQSEFIYLLIGMIYRIFTICTKYATFDPFKIEAIKNHIFEPKDLRSDFFLFDWREQKDRIIFEEIYFAQRAYDIDPSWFYLEFIVDPEKETKERFLQNNETLSKFFTSKDQSFQPEPINITNKNSQVFYIYGIIKEIVDNFQANNKFQIDHASSIAFVYSVLRALVPTIYKFADNDYEYLKNAQWYEWIISFNIAFLTQKLYYYTVWTIIQGVIDMKRKIYMMDQLAFMISPRKLRSIDSDKLFPTINIFKSNNLKAWQLMRHVCQEYGKRYDIRVQANITGMVLDAIVAIIILVLSYTDVIHMEQCFIIILVIETTCVLFVIIQVLYHGAKINEQFDLHDSILTYNKSIVMDIYRMRRRYFCQQFKTTNYLYSKAVQKIRDEVYMLKLDNPCSYIKEIVRAYDTHIDELQFDQRQNPFTIGSIKITNGLLESGIIGVVSIIIAIVGKFLSNRLE